jgi:hypothetical protein
VNAIICELKSDLVYVPTFVVSIIFFLVESIVSNFIKI